jgi:deazaflavin-dependent oxidoreductase (nitroreductase family)
MSKATLWVDHTIGRFIYPVHRRLYEATGGIVGYHSGFGPMLLLTTTGRVSGQARTTPLLFMGDGRDYLVVASNGGRDRPPAWLGNLQARPEGAVQVRRTKVAVVATVLDEDAKAEVWPRLVAHYRGWDEYQHLTARPIAVVRLSPA